MEAAASEFGYCPPRSSDAKTAGAGDHFVVEDLLDFSNDDGTFDNLTAGSDTSTVVTPVESCNSSTFSATAADPNFPPPGDFPCRSFVDPNFSGDFSVPCEDLAELEWLSNFVEESFSSEDLQKLQLISGMSAMKTRSDEGSETRYYNPEPTRPANCTSPIFSPDISVPGKARSKRSRAAPGNWTSRLLALSNPTHPVLEPVPTGSGTIKPSKAITKKKGKGGLGDGAGSGSGPDLVNGEVRKCLHCATDKTPQWRTGPMGPKTLCNACGVRYKSGRLVPEYRPAASPTFLLTKHSNSHRKVMELRRQKELMRQQQLQQQQQYQQQLIHDPNNIMFDPTNSDDYLIHQHIGPEFRQLI